MQTIQCRRLARYLAVVGVAAGLSACVIYPPGAYVQGPPVNQVQSYPGTGYPMPQYAVLQPGQVLNVETVRVPDPSGIGAGGAIVGAALGGVLGHQIGHGSGRALATMAGVLGGALAGNAVQNTMGGGSVRDLYRVTVLLQDGSTRAFDYPYAPNLQPGDSVRVSGHQLLH